MHRAWDNTTFSNWKKTHEIRKLREEAKELKASIEVNTAKILSELSSSWLDFDQEEANMLNIVSDIIAEIILKEIEEEEKKNNIANN